MAETPADQAAMEELVASLRGPLEITVFVATGCPNCPHAVRAVEGLAAMRPDVISTIVNAAESVELASRYQVRSVPTIVVNEELTIVGVVTQTELLRRVLESQGADGDDVIFISLMKSGRIEDATAVLVDGRGIPAFGRMWNESALESRIGLSLVAQNAAAKKPGALDGLVGFLQPSVKTDDTARRGDTADLLGVIGHESARPALLQLMEDSDEEVAEIAADALERVAERAAGSGGGSGGR